MADEREWKAGIFRVEQDFSDETNQVISKAQQFQKDGKLEEAIDALLQMEKTTRLGNDTKSTVKLSKEIVNILIEAREWDLLTENVDLLVKKRSQMKQVQSAVIQAAVTAVPLAPTEEIRVQLIKKLRAICEAKIHVELEYARLTVELAKIWDKNGQLKEACKMIQLLQVETIGNMDRKEKFDVILMQVEMSLRTEDYVVAHIMAKKIPARVIDKDETLSHKIRFYTLMIQYYTHFDNHFMVCKCYSEIYNTVFSPSFKPEELDNKYKSLEEKLEVLQNVLLYLWLSAYNARPDTLEDEGAKAKAVAEGKKYTINEFTNMHEK